MPFAVERLHVVAEQGSRLQRRAIVRAPKVVAIEQPQLAFLARRDEKLPAAIVEGHRRDVQIEVAAEQPVGVWRGEVVDKLQLLVGVELHRDDRRAEAVGLGGERRVAGAHEHAALRIDRDTAAAPHASAGRREDARLLRGEIVRKERVRVAAASLCRGRVDDAVERDSARTACRWGRRTCPAAPRRRPWPHRGCEAGHPTRRAYNVYLPFVGVVVMTGTAVCPPGHNVLPTPVVTDG